MYDLIAIGDMTLDVFLQIHDAEKLCRKDMRDCVLALSWADKIPVDELHTVPCAGNAGNVAVGAARLGLKTALVSMVGQDDIGMKITKALVQEGVHQEYVAVDAGQPSNYNTVINFQGERTILVYHHPRTYKLPPLSPTKWVYYTSMGKGYESFQRELLTWLAQYPEIKLAYNPGTHQMNDGLEAMKLVLARCEVVFVNKEEAEKILGQKGEINMLLKVMQKLGPKIVVITDGQNGAWVFEGKETWYMPVFSKEFVEKTGAGDAYATGFVTALHAGCDIGIALRWASAESTSVVNFIGPQKGLLDQAGMDEMLKKYKKVTASRCHPFDKLRAGSERSEGSL